MSRNTESRWVVSIGCWHFGPLSYDEAYDFKKLHGGKMFPLWLPAELDALSGKLAVERAKREFEWEHDLGGEA